jgi:hypothetical protein
MDWLRMTKRTSVRRKEPQRPWPAAPRYDQEHFFVFMSVDVIGHSGLFARCKTKDEKLMLDEALTELMQHISGCIPSYKPRLLWDWAGDGGLYAFPISFNPSDLGFVDVHDAARAIFARLDEFNALHVIRYNDGTVEPIRLRVVLTAGQAVYRKQPQLRRGTALNVVGKIKIASNANSLALTQDVYSELRTEAKRNFVLLPPWWAPSPASTPVTTTLYADIERLRASMLSRVTEHIERREPLLAAHYRFRLASVALAHLDLNTATEELQQAEELATKGPVNASYYHRTIAAFYRAWRTVLQHDSIRTVVRTSTTAPYARMALLLSPEMSSACKEEGCNEELRMLIDLEGVAEQLELLAAAFVDGATGLSTLQICRLLLRCGYSPSARDGKISRRLDRLERDLVPDGTLDVHCSLCTATGVSCLALSGRRPNAQRSIKWLRQLGKYSYCFRGRRTTYAKSPEHAMHYAASVLQAFIDSDAAPRTILAVISKFFGLASPKAMISRWTKWRNESSPEVLFHIFSAFLSMFLAGQHRLLTRLQVKRISFAFDCLRVELEREEREVHTGSGVVFYAIREHLVSYSLAHLLGDRAATKQMETTMDWLHDSIVLKHNLGAAPSGPRLLDSQLDSTLTILEGIVSYYEVKLLMREPKWNRAMGLSRLQSDGRVKRKRTISQP